MLNRTERHRSALTSALNKPLTATTSVPLGNCGSLYQSCGELTIVNSFRLCAQHSTTATLSRSAFQHTYSGASSLFSSQRCGSSGVSTKSSRSCLGRPCNSTLAASTTTSRLQGGHHAISLCCTVSRHRTLMILFVSPTCPVVADFARHHQINCLFHHSGSQPSINAHFQSLHRSSATHCHLT